MNDLPIDFDALSLIPLESAMALMEKRRIVAQFFALAMRTIQDHSTLFQFLEKREGHLRIDPDLECFYISFTGTGTQLRAVWSEFRRNGFNPTNRPKKGDISILVCWTKKGAARFTMRFCSSVCKRVQIGTEMKEVPVYETQCDAIEDIELIDREFDSNCHS